MRSADDLTAAARIRDAAIAEFGRQGFDVSLRTIAKTAGVSPALVIHHFGSKEGLRAACDEFVAEAIRETKTASLQTSDPSAWFARVAEIDSFAPLMAYLVRSLQTGGDLATSLWRTMISNAEQYIEDGVRAGTIKPSRDPAARARYLAIVGGGGFLLYLQMHDDPTNMRAVLADYARDMLLPSLEVYTHGLLTDSTMYDAFASSGDLGTETRASEGFPRPDREEST